MTSVDTVIVPGKKSIFPFVTFCPSFSHINPWVQRFGFGLPVRAEILMKT